ncbi:START domain-containing protein [Chromobacterium vaccinii]|uniref:START domain-containing protein n=1 Tax=Chromobacterium vaccinii TaxID=1108595 RepID=UPI00061831A5|nr:START domain-containing protein [Chromobacterium vaccinii]
MSKLENTLSPAAMPAPAKRGSRLRRLGKALIYAVPALALLSVLGNWLWMLSGSNRWELQSDADGVQVYTMKTPGSSALRVRGITTMKQFSLSNHIAPFLDESIQNNCAEWVQGCLGYRIVQPWDPRSGSIVTLWSVELFPPFTPREMLLLGQLRQDPATGVVTLENIAAPNKLPPNENRVRLEHMHNVFRYTPQQDGAVKVEVLYDMDMGGGFPQWAQNLMAPMVVRQMLTKDIPRQLNQEKYRKARFDFLSDRTLAKH